MLRSAKFSMLSFASLSLILRNPHAQRGVVVGFFVTVFLIGFSSFNDYGIAVDEGTMDALGKAAHEYVFGDAEWPSHHAWRHHGTLIELPIFMASNFIADPVHLSELWKRVYTQHFMVFLLSFFGLVMLYVLARKYFGDWKWALLCCLCFFLTPRFFAHSFYNSRDIPTLTLFTTSMVTLLRALERKTIWSFVLHGFASGLTLSLRMPALIIPIITIFFFALDEWKNWVSDKKLHIRRSAILLGTYHLILIITTIAFWPFLWEQPLTHFLEAYTFMSMSSEGVTSTFLGRAYDGAPLLYIPVWMLITIPPLFTVFFFLGVFTQVITFVRHPLRTLLERRNELLFLVWFFLPIISILLKGSGIYTEWRHIFFIYPAFLLITVIGIRAVARLIGEFSRSYAKIFSAAFALIVAVQLASTALWMIRNHPLEFAYFSVPSRWLHESFYKPSPDYWGLSYKEGMEFLIHHDRGIMSLYSDDNIGYQNMFNIFPESLGRVVRVPQIEDAMYVVTRSPEVAKDLPLLHAVTVDDMLLSGVYKGLVKEVLIDEVKETIEFRK